MEFTRVPGPECGVTRKRRARPEPRAGEVLVRAGTGGGGTCATSPWRVLAPASCRRRGPRGRVRGCAGGYRPPGWGGDLTARAILVRRIRVFPSIQVYFRGSRYLARGNWAHDGARKYIAEKIAEQTGQPHERTRTRSRSRNAEWERDR